MSDADDREPPGERTAPPQHGAPEDERTHLLLDPACLIDESEDPPDARGRAASGGARRTDDDERTHLLLDPACLIDEDQEAAGPAAQALFSKSEARAAAPTQEPADDQRTLLFIDAALDEQQRARLSEPPSSTGGAEPRPAGDSGAEERTRLMLGSLILKDEPSALLAAPGERLGWLQRQTRRLGLPVDDLMHHRWPGALALAALWAIVGSWATGGELGSVAVRLGSVALSFGIAAHGLAWLGKLQPHDGGSSSAAARIRSAARLLALELVEFQTSPRHLQLLATGHALALVGFIGLAGTSLLHVVFGVQAAMSAVRVPSGVLLLVGLASMRFARRWGILAPAPDELGESLEAATQLPALLDLSEPLPPSFIAGYTPLHRILIALSQWRHAPWPDQAGYRAALERHLRQHLPACSVEREKWLGRSRSDGIADLVVDDAVLIEVAQGFEPRAAARALARLAELARAWPGKPMLLVGFEARREAVFQSASTASLLELHRRFHLLTARMPSREAS